MKRDMDLVREILIAVEANPSPVAPLSPFSIEGFEDALTFYNVERLQEAGFLTALDNRTSDTYELYPIALTWSGHEFLETIRDPEVWKKTKAGANAVKSWSFDTLKDIGKGLIKKQIEEYTGVKL